MKFLEEWIWFFQFEGKEIVKDLLKVIHMPSKTAFYFHEDVINKDISTLSESQKDIVKDWETYFQAISEYREEDLIRLYRLLFYLRMHYATFYIPTMYSKIITIRKIVNDWDFYEMMDYDKYKLAMYIYAWGTQILNIPFDLVEFLNNNNIDLYIDYIEYTP